MEKPIDVKKMKLTEAWNKFVLLKVATLIWRLLHDRMSSKDNLHMQEVLNDNQFEFSYVCGLIESVYHIFFECDFSFQVCFKTLRWLNVSTVMHNVGMSNFQQFRGLCGKGKNRVDKFSVISLLAFG